MIYFSKSQEDFLKVNKSMSQQVNESMSQRVNESTSLQAKKIRADTCDTWRQKSTSQ